ncbi:MAG: Tim44-like domain-containing protein [Pseudomonadota bacterium]
MKKQVFASMLAFGAMTIAHAAPAVTQDGGGSMMGTLIGGALFAIVLIGAGLFAHRTMKRGDTPASPAVTAPAPARPDAAAESRELILRSAKASFIRMQAAWDKADTADLSKFTTPQVFAELKTQVEARGPSPNVTEVVTIEAELLGVETAADHFLASVKFTGMIKSSTAAPAEPFVEVWNLSKALRGSGGWLLAGIQQLS